MRREVPVDEGLLSDGTSDLSALMTSWNIPKENAHNRIKLIEILLKARSCLKFSFRTLLRSWISSPYDLVEAMSLVKEFSHDSDPLLSL